jgi:acetylornithine deacetylase
MSHAGHPHVPDVVSLTQALIAIPSPSATTNAPISDYLKQVLTAADFTVEELAYDDNGERKVSLVAVKGSGEGGFGFFSHSDTVPGAAGPWEPYIPWMQDGRLIGRGACDMKGPLAATIVAAAAVPAAGLRHPLYVVVTADEEVGYGGAKQVAAESQLLAGRWPTHGVVAEPTRLRPVYAHKGGRRVTVTAHGVAAHTSTDRGISANFLIAPFLAEMAELAKLFKTEERFLNRAFDPPTNGFNMVLNDGGTAGNVTAAETVCTLGFRPMPGDASEEALNLILDAAARHNLSVDTYGNPPFTVEPDAEIVQAALAASGRAAAETVPFGTEAVIFDRFTQLVVLGPGDIAQAHTIGEWIDVAQLQEAVEVYGRLIQRFCLAA